MTRFRFTNLGNGVRQVFIYVAFDVVEFFLAITYGKEGDAGRIREQLAHVGDGIPRNQASFQRHLRQLGVGRVALCSHASSGEVAVFSCLHI